MRAVITGATGVVGSALVKELLENGWEVLALLRPDSPRNENLPDSPALMRADCPLEDLHLLENKTKKTWDVFFHLGWSGTKGPDRMNLYIHNKNVEYALDAVAAAERLGCGLFVGAGSQAEYGRTDARLAPDTPAFPENAYGIAKLCAGQMTREYAHQLGMRQIWTRILSVYGPNDGEKTLVTYMIRSLLAGQRPVCTAGEQVWDYLESSDAARALRMIAERGHDGEIYMIASGRERKLRNYVEEIRDIVSPGADIGFGEAPYGKRQVMHISADISKTARDTGWTPRVSFSEGVRSMACSMREKSTLH